MTTSHSNPSHRARTLALRLSVGLLAACAAAGCDTKSDAPLLTIDAESDLPPMRLGDASGIEDGTKVFVRGIEVGRVRGVKLEGETVRVQSRLLAGHALTLAAGACVERRDTTPPSLAIRPGAGAEIETRELVECAPSTTVEVDDDGCPDDVLSVEFSAAKSVPASLFLPDGGWRVELTFSNAGPEFVEIGSSTDVIFVAADGAAFESESLPGERDWFMPFTLGPGKPKTVPVFLHKDGETPPELVRLKGVSYDCRGR